ncbi:Uncharacterized protein OBRU01_02145, partial [Operophtera brumata]
LVILCEKVSIVWKLEKSYLLDLYTLTTSFDLRGVIHGNRMAGVPLGSSLGAGEVDVEGICSQSGMACQNCSLAVTCIPLPLGWLKVPLEECAEGLTCNAHLGQCSQTPVPECDGSQEYTHNCEQGLPDGRPANHGIALCPRHYGYNPQTAQCSVIPTCAKVGDSGAVKSSLNHYYVCLMKQRKLYPQIFICPHGWYFWGGFCRPEAEPTTPESKPSEKSPTDVTTAKTTTEKATKKPVYKVDSFFSTDKAITYAPDTFLADKLDLANYETVDDVVQNNDDFFNSFENSFN